MSKPIPRDLAGRAIAQILGAMHGDGRDVTALDELQRHNAAPPPRDLDEPSPALQRKLDELAKRAEDAERKLAELAATISGKAGDK